MTEYKQLKPDTYNWLIALLALADNHTEHLRQTCTDRGVNHDALPECNRWLDVWERAKSREVEV